MWRFGISFTSHRIFYWFLCQYLYIIVLLAVNLQIQNKQICVDFTDFYRASARFCSEEQLYDFIANWNRKSLSISFIIRHLGQIQMNFTLIIRKLWSVVL